jgi:palmitoyl-protein thioesterase
MVHGFSFFLPGQGSYHDYDHVVGWLARAHPGQVSIAMHMDDGYDSGKPLATQTAEWTTALQGIVASDPNVFAKGFHLIGHSQGAVLARSVLQTRSWNVSTFVSLAGVHGGFYGDCGVNWTCTEATDFFYTTEQQNSFSVANLWRSPGYEEYLTKNKFLPVYTNEVSHPDMAKFRTNFMQAKQYHFFSSPADEAIRPWFSGVWGFYAPDSSTMVPMMLQPSYLKDTIGLKTLDKLGKVNLHIVEGIKHTDWLRNEDVFTSKILPLLV